MARKIAETPILYGKDAIRFMERMKQAETEKVSPEVLERMRKDYEAVKAIEK